MKLVITIDTEEDNWGSYQESSYTCRNIGRIPFLQELFDKFTIRPTYLVTYPVVSDRRALVLLKEIADSGRCEIGTHCHPWNTPPYEEERTARNSMLCNLPSDLQYRKIRTLHEAIERNFGVSPVSFRAGRWGFNASIGSNLVRLGYTIDSSVTAYTDWTTSHGPDFSDIAPHAYFCSMNGRVENFPDRQLAELPATVGYLQSSFLLSNFGNKIFARKPWNRLRLNGLLSRGNLLNKVSLSPEVSTAANMIELTETMRRMKYHVINLFFHSTSLLAGRSPFVKSKEDEIELLSRIAKFLRFTENSGIESITLAQVPDLIRASVPTDGNRFS